MRITLIVSISLVMLLSLTISPANAEGEDSGHDSSDGISFGLGADWGGLGLNYLVMPEDSPVGFSIGVGTVLAGVGASAFIVTSLGDDNALFTGAGLGAVGGFGAGAIFIEYGNLPTAYHPILWRVGIGYANPSDDEEIFPVVGFGWSW